MKPRLTIEERRQARLTFYKGEEVDSYIPGRILDEKAVEMFKASGKAPTAFYWDPPKVWGE